MSTKSIFVWSPFTGKVGTVQNVINSLYSLNKYSKFETNLINAFGEWDPFLDDSKLKKVFIHNFKFLKFLKKWNTSGFLKSRISYLLIFLFSFFPLLNLIKEKKPSYLIVHLISSLPLVIFYLFNFKTKLILHIAGHPKLNIFRKIIWKISSKNIAKIICPSEELKKIFIKNNIFQDKQLIVIEDPHLVIEKITELRKTELNDNFFNNSKILIAIGRMTKQKNYAFLLKNFKKLTMKYSDIKLIIIGDGEEKNNLQNLIMTLDISSKVKLIDYEFNIYKYLKNSNYYISTSIWEGSSLAMVDAAYIGIPLLCSDCPSGRKEFIGDNERGFLYKENNDEDFLINFSKMYSLNSNEINNLLVNAKKQTKKFTLFKSFLKLSQILN
tara:strand:+ start:1717 stop:2865 length:1149 start_codon:yes stop_codon:yes gene_type:complete